MDRPTATTSFPEELNLARYLDLVRRRWSLILLCGVLAALAAAGWGILQPKTYLAQAYVAILRMDTTASFGSRIQTVSDTDPNQLQPEVLARRRSILLLANDEVMARQVIAKMVAQLPDSLQVPAKLANRVNVTTDGDLLLVQVNANDPELAAAIANTWAAEYVARLNNLYGTTAESGTVTQEQSAQARREYDARQAAVVAFLQTSDIESLKRQQAALALQLDEQVRLENKLTQLQSDVEALRSRLQATGATVSSADTLTQILIQASAFNNGGDPSQVRLDISPAAGAGSTTADQLQQLETLSRAIEQRRNVMGAAQKQSLYQQLNTVQAQLEQAQQQLKDLQAARDLAWTTLQSVNTKSAEVQVANSAKNQVVQIAANAVAPDAPLSSKTLIFGLVGGALGLFVGFLLALVWDYSSARSRVLKPAPQ